MKFIPALLCLFGLFGCSSIPKATADRVPVYEAAGANSNTAEKIEIYRRCSISELKSGYMKVNGEFKNQRAMNAYFRIAAWNDGNKRFERMGSRSIASQVIPTGIGLIGGALAGLLYDARQPSNGTDITSQRYWEGFGTAILRIVGGAIVGAVALYPPGAAIALIRTNSFRKRIASEFNSMLQERLGLSEADLLAAGILQSESFRVNVEAPKKTPVEKGSSPLWIEPGPDTARDSRQFWESFRVSEIGYNRVKIGGTYYTFRMAARYYCESRIREACSFGKSASQRSRIIRSEASDAQHMSSPGEDARTQKMLSTLGVKILQEPPSSISQASPYLEEVLNWAELAAIEFNCGLAKKLGMQIEACDEGRSEWE